MKKLLLLILKLSLVLFLSLMVFAGWKMNRYGFDNSIAAIIGIASLVGLIFSAGIAIRKVYIQELEIKHKRLTIAIILSIFWAAWWTASIGGDYLVFSRIHTVYGLIWRFLIAFLPLLYFLMKDNRISQKPVKESTNVLREEGNNSTESVIKNLRLFKEKKYQMAFSEVEENNIQNKELWAKAFAQCGGDTEKQKSIYVKLRTKELYGGQKFTPIKFEIKQFIWLIILVVLTVLIASQNQYYFWYALGSVAAMVVKDGLIVAVPVGIFMFFSSKKYHWYDWLNMLAYVTVIIRLIGVLIDLSGQ